MVFLTMRHSAKKYVLGLMLKDLPGPYRQWIVDENEGGERIQESLKLMVSKILQISHPCEKSCLRPSSTFEIESQN